MKSGQTTSQAKCTLASQPRRKKDDRQLVNLSARIPAEDRQIWRAEATIRGMTMQEAAWFALKAFLGDPETLRKRNHE